MKDGHEFPEEHGFTGSAHVTKEHRPHVPGFKRGQNVHVKQVKEADLPIDGMPAVQAPMPTNMKHGGLAHVKSHHKNYSHGGRIEHDGHPKHKHGGHHDKHGFHIHNTPGLE